MKLAWYRITIKSGNKFVMPAEDCDHLHKIMEDAFPAEPFEAIWLHEKDFK